MNIFKRKQPLTDKAKQLHDMGVDYTDALVAGQLCDQRNPLSAYLYLEQKGYGVIKLIDEKDKLHYILGITL